MVVTVRHAGRLHYAKALKEVGTESKTLCGRAPVEPVGYQGRAAAECRTCIAILTRSRN